MRKRVKKGKRRAARSRPRPRPRPFAYEEPPARCRAVLIGLSGGIREIEVTAPPPPRIAVPVADDSAGDLDRFLSVTFERDHSTAGTGTARDRVYYYRERGTYTAIRRAMIERLRGQVEAVLRLRPRRGRRRVTLTRAVDAVFASASSELDPKPFRFPGLEITFCPPEHPNCRSEVLR